MKDKPLWKISMRDGHNAMRVFESFNVVAPTFEAAVRLANKRLGTWRRQQVTSMRIHSVVLVDLVVVSI